MGRRILPQSALRRFMIAPWLMPLSGWPVSPDASRVFAGSLLRGFFRIFFFQRPRREVFLEALFRRRTTSYSWSKNPLICCSVALSS
uniref:Putative secreted protein n=1 Tax=Anopheles marajoara TaxID=58244 RepID=A0A2M4CBK1_9DIPT